MERSVALKKLSKILGKNCGYQIDPKAPDQDERDAAKAELPAAREDQERLEKARQERASFLLRNDNEYQILKKAHEVAKERREKLSEMMRWYRITVGVSTSLFFEIKAQADTWDEIFAKLEKDRVT